MSSDEAYNKNNISQFVPQLFQGMSFLGFPQNIRYPVLLTLKHFTFQLAKGRKKTAKTSIKQLGYQRADMLMLKRSTSRDETAIGQLRISVLLHEARTGKLELGIRTLFNLCLFGNILVFLSIMSQSGDRLKQLEEIEKVRTILSRLGLSLL